MDLTCSPLPRITEIVTGPQHSESLRIFCAVSLSEEARQRAAAHVARLREIAPRAKISWVRPESLHLTLKFFGEIDAAMLDKIARASGRAAAGCAPFALRLNGSGNFPPRAAKSRILWLDVADDHGRLAHLQTRLEDECVAEDFPREAQAFRPHLTLARVRVADAETRRAAVAHSESGFAPVSVPVEALAVMRSELGPGGARYTICSLHQLKGPRQAPE